MDNNLKTATYNCCKRITDLEAIRIARKIKNDPNIQTAEEPIDIKFDFFSLIFTYLFKEILIKYN